MTIMRRHLATLAAFALPTALLCSAMPAQAAERAPAGGYSFSGASEITADRSTAKQTYAFGETLYWKIYAKPGQSLTAKASLAIPQGMATEVLQSVHVKIFDPARQEADCGSEHGRADKGYYMVNSRAVDAGKPIAPWCGTGGGDSRDQEDEALTQAGYYTVALQVQHLTEAAAGTGVPLTLTVRRGKGSAPEPEEYAPGTPSPGVTVQKQGSGASGVEGPESGTESDGEGGAGAGSSPSDGGDQAATGSDSASATDYAVIGGVALAGLLVGFFAVNLLGRRRANAPAGPGFPPGPGPNSGAAGPAPGGTWSQAPSGAPSPPPGHYQQPQSPPYQQPQQPPWPGNGS
ncbi:hypothetical protein ACFYWS_25655 [Streptomyces sp. NPDC002795]|uniref:hypothetical protein n=1 Tax=Streptomyces sp. NPDC002795 TaxID=3364665 RepID=UPI0036B7DD40